MNTIDKVKNVYDEFIENRYFENTPGFFEELSKLGFKKLGSGISRFGFGNGDIVVKYGHYKCNNEEYDCYQRLLKFHPVIKHVLCPCFGTYGTYKNNLSFWKQCKSFKFLIDPFDGKKYIDPSLTYVKNLHFRQWKALMKFFKDLHDNNVGILDDRLVAYDINYGYKENLGIEWFEYMEQIYDIKPSELCEV